MILETFLVNKELVVKYFDPLDLCTITAVSKDLQLIAKHALKQYKLSDLRKYETPIPEKAICKFCTCILDIDIADTHLKQGLCCEDCFYRFYICRTDVKHKYKLTNNDLNYVSHIKRIILPYRRTANYFCENDIRRLAIIINQSLSDVVTKTYSNRIQRLNKIYDKLSISENDLTTTQYDYIIDPYKKKGRHGIRSVEFALKRWYLFEKNCLEVIKYRDFLQDTELDNIRICYSLGEIDETVAIEELSGISYRRKLICDKVKEEDPSLHVDHNFLNNVSMCSDYIHYGMFNLSEVVNTLLVEMFLKEIDAFSVITSNMQDAQYSFNSYTNMIDFDEKHVKYIISMKVQLIDQWIQNNPGNIIPKYVKTWLQNEKQLRKN